MTAYRNRGINRHVTATIETHNVEWASPKQQEAFKYGPIGAGRDVGGPICISGGFNSAKTWALSLKGLWLSTTFPNNRGVIFRRVWNELERTTMSTFFKICPPYLYRKPGKRSDSEKYLRLANGSEILWMHMDDPDIQGVIRGLEINWFFGDQAEESEEELFDMLMSRLGRWDKAEVPEWMLEEERAAGRPWAWLNPVTGKPLVPTYAMLACNPDVELHWIYRRFHPDSYEWQTAYRDMGYKMIQMAATENKFITKQNLDIMLSKDESFVRRYVKGLWGSPEGRIHDVHESSILDYDSELLDYLRNAASLHRSMDHGDASPTCCLWSASDRDGNLFFYREYYMPNMLISEHRENIWRMSSWNGIPERYVTNLADPSIFYLTMQKYGGRWSVADEYSDPKCGRLETRLFWQPADNNEMGTRNRISEYLRPSVEERIHPITKEKGHWPRVFFVRASAAYPEGCHHLITELRSQRRLRIGTDNGRPIFSDERDKTIPDHAYDPFRYAVASRPSIPGSLPYHLSRKTFEGGRRMMLRFRQSPNYRRALLKIQGEP